jgi:CheY-like chemotaxis protein
VDDLAFQLEAHAIAVTLDLAADLPPVWADGTQIYQVVINLLTNALYALRETSGPRRLAVGSAYDGAGRVRFHVTDTGPGIAAEQQRHLFEPFFTTKPVGAGSGLGLSVCRGIIQAHGGTIDVVSAAHGGTRFVITLPVAAAATAPSLPEADVRPPAVQGKRVLVVDDDRGVRDLLVEILAVDGHQVEAAGDGQTALAMLAGCDFDVVVTDVRMPLLDTHDLYRSFRDHPQLRRRFVFVTDNPLDDHTRDFMEATGAAVLVKPLDPGLVRRVVQDTLRGR